MLKNIMTNVFMRSLNARDLEEGILYFFMVGKKAVLTNGFIKKSQTIPVQEIETVIQYRSDYLRRER
jgi:phage-related protein